MTRWYTQYTYLGKSSTSTQGLAHRQETVISNAQTQKLSSPIQKVLPLYACIFPMQSIQRRPLMDEIEMIQTKQDDHQQPTRIALHICVRSSLLRIVDNDIPSIESILRGCRSASASYASYTVAPPARTPQSPSTLIVTNSAQTNEAVPGRVPIKAVRASLPWIPPDDSQYTLAVQRI